MSVWLLSILAMSPLPQGSFVLQVCLWLQGVWCAPGYFYTPGKMESCHGPSCLASSAAQLAYLLDFFWSTWEWLSPLVLLDLSLKHKGWFQVAWSLIFPERVTLGPP